MKLRDTTGLLDAPAPLSEERQELGRSVCAVVVTFHPPQVDIDNLAFISGQARHVVVVDNGSDDIELANLRETCRLLNFHLIENGANLGIAAALNTGIRWALSQGCGWVVLFDQDSRPSAGFVEKLLSAVLGSPQAQQVAIMVPSYLDARSNARVRGAVRSVTGELLAAQTSGSLLPAAVFEKEGLFDESFFIDWVDFDFCLRVKSHGWVIEESTSAVLLHKVAYPKAYNIFGVKVFDTTNYSPVRRYYRTRNVLWMFRRHRKRYFVFCAKMVGAALKDILKIAAEENRWNKLRSAFRGCMDGVCRSMNTAVIQSERT